MNTATPTPTSTPFPAPVPPSLAIVGSTARFPVRRIYCVGQNYAAHAREMGSDPAKVAPFFFMKPGDAVFEPARQGVLPFPGATQNLHHEVEWVLALGAPLHRASEAEAAAAVWGHAVGLDLTRRDLQAEAKAGGKPWDTAKGFDRSAVMGPVVPLQGPLPTQGEVRLSVNGSLRQQGDLADLIASAPRLLAELSRYFELQPGDLVFTGTPSGVGPLQPGDRVDAHVAGLPDLHVEFGGV